MRPTVNVTIEAANEEVAQGWRKRILDLAAGNPNVHVEVSLAPGKWETAGELEEDPETERLAAELEAGTVTLRLALP